MEIVEIKLCVFMITNISNQANSTGWIRFYSVDVLSEACSKSHDAAHKP